MMAGRLDHHDLRRLSAVLDQLYDEGGPDARLTPLEMAVEPNMRMPTLDEAAETVARAGGWDVASTRAWIAGVLGHQANPVSCPVCGARRHRGACWRAVTRQRAQRNPLVMLVGNVPPRGWRGNPGDAEIRELERCAAQGDAMAAQRLTILQARAGTVSPMEAAKIPGEWNLILERAYGRGQWTATLVNPQGGSGGGNRYRSVKAAIAAELGRMGPGWAQRRDARERVFVIEANFDGNDWMPTKSYWVSMAPYVRAAPAPIVPGSDEYWRRLTNPAHGAAIRGLPRGRVKGTIPLTEAIRRGIPGIREAVSRFRKFHGCEPTGSITIYDDGRKDQVAGFLIGRAPELVYDDVPRGSNKQGSTWVHKTSKARPTFLAHIPMTEQTVLVGGMRVTDWMRG